MQKLWFVLGLVLILSFGCPQMETSECPPCLYAGQECPECETCEVCEVCPELPEERALLATEVYDWGYLGSDAKEVAFTFNLYNYGDVEAKNVIVRCFLYNLGTDAKPKNELVMSVDEDIGNIASISYQQEQIVGEAAASLTTYEYYLANCYPINCEKCDILAMRIPEIEELIKESGPISGFGFAEKAKAID